MWDFPGQIDYFDSSFDSYGIFGNTGALVYVIDAQVWGRKDVKLRVGVLCEVKIEVRVAGGSREG